MSSFTTVGEYKDAIMSEIDSIADAATRRIIQDLIVYAEETEADNRELRPRPDGSENAAFYREIIDENNLPTQSLKNLIEGLLQLVEGLENQT